ncbi:transglutaminase-like putative cysteine protease [Prosthecobacter fusiformis]|uniref:Transglutaminase-like putative cysteine protease n=1 Tax=Prosthecobacter fusiformis TaxID=48464 RepID=A0A4R7RUA2_9BACT|nr:transglutaminase family protein [Prosthecobacter fusiformis]TDU69314.1 transglutaminase-like putative cysteine protease [Prosthecobacter fusiformis]
MRRYYIEHRTVYRYAEPVNFGLHRLVLRPREGHDITVVKHELTVQPEAKLFWLTDLFGNSIALAEIAEPADKLEIVNVVIIDRVEGPEDEAPQLRSRASEVTMPVTYPQMELGVVSGYIAPVYEDDAAAVASWADAQRQTVPEPTALSMVTHLNRCINAQIKYMRREERGVQSPARTLTLGTGSCRDMATLLMEACRALGIAARFVSGYLDAMAAAAGRGSTHAWVEVYLPDSGWRGFDPTVGDVVSRKHVPLGVSAHPRGVMPVSGIYDGPPGSYQGLDVAITIRQIDCNESLHSTAKEGR